MGYCLLDDKTILVGSAYCTPDSNTESLKRVLQNIKKAKDYCHIMKIKNILVYGDFNARSEQWGDHVNNGRGKCLSEFTRIQDFVLCSPGYRTFLSPNNGGSIIDLLLAFGDITEKIVSQWTDEVTELFTGAPIRGHLPVFTSLLKPGSYSKNKMGQNDRKLCLDLDNAPWSEWSKELDNHLTKNFQDISLCQNAKELLNILNNSICGIKKVLLVYLY